MATGAAIASANTAAATSSAYAAGYAQGASYAALPSGCTMAGGYYQCGNTWFKPAYGANGVFYQVVPPP
jgi:hypothetical protein